MSEHRRGVDEADVVRALQRAGAAETGVDVNALAAGARGRARTIRRRRQGVVGVVAVLALGVPIGLSQWPGTPPTVVPIATATPSPSTVTAIPDALLPTTQEVTAVLPGVEPLEGPNPSTDTGFCTTATYDGAASVVDSRSLSWGGEPSVVSPFPENASVRVMLFRGAAAEDWMAAVGADAQACTQQTDETAPWQLADQTGVQADQVVAGTAAYQQYGNNPMWRSAVVARQGQLVVRVDLESYQSTSSDALTRAADLATTALGKAATLQDAGGAPR
ncbi:hypothetical protein ACFQ46_20805 [Kineococcus sp. GCM10028916]|uniref:hypothetical protein n=1 Tax=Kineococcus sp. GCM10028916 TaxID=3273394 RepID=UPI00362D14DB